MRAPPRRARDRARKKHEPENVRWGQPARLRLNQRGRAFQAESSARPHFKGAAVRHESETVLPVVPCEALSRGHGSRGSSRSEVRRVGKECGSMCKSRWSPYHSTKTNIFIKVS